jgi:hypothetical protein
MSFGTSHFFILHLLYKHEMMGKTECMARDTAKAGGEDATCVDVGREPERASAGVFV